MYLKERQIISTSPPTPVSIIVCVKNGEQYIRTCLDNILKQDYPEFEIVLVDDFSLDQTWSILKEYANRHSTIKIVKADIDLPGKKAALKQGILNAKYSLLLLTDIDCLPESKYWIKHMVNCIKDGDIALGLGHFNARKGILNKWIRFEGLMTSIQFMSMALIQNPYMGVGRNMLVRKKVYESIDYFNGHTHIASGDDDLMIQEAKKYFEIKVCLEKGAMMYSDGKDNLRSYLWQKRRHISTSAHYDFKTKAYLGLYFLSTLGFYLGVIGLGFFLPIYIIVLLLILRWLVFWLVFSGINQNIGYPDLKGSFFYLDVLMFIYMLVNIPNVIFTNNKSW